jgi:hypothetical protein
MCQPWKLPVKMKRIKDATTAKLDSPCGKASSGIIGDVAPVVGLTIISTYFED